MSRIAKSIPNQRSIPLSEVRLRLSELIQLVKEGIRIVITEHGRAVVDLVPHGAARASIERRVRPKTVPLARKVDLLDLLGEVRGNR